VNFSSYSFHKFFQWASRHGAWIWLFAASSGGTTSDNRSAALIRIAVATFQIKALNQSNETMRSNLNCFCPFCKFFQDHRGLLLAIPSEVRQWTTLLQMILIPSRTTDM